MGALGRGCGTILRGAAAGVAAGALDACTAGFAAAGAAAAACATAATGFTAAAG